MDKKTKKRYRFDLGAAVIKESGDYTYQGVVVARFRKISGLIRYVVEDKRGLLFIFNDTSLQPDIPF